MTIAVRHQLQRQIAVLACRGADDNGAGVIADLQITAKLRRAQQILDSKTEIGRAAQIKEAAGHAVEPDDLALRVQNDDAIGQGRGGTLQLSHELHETLLVEALAPMQTNNLGDDFTEDTAHIRRIGIAAMAQPPLETKQVGQLPTEMQRERHAQTYPHGAEQPTNEQATQHRREHSSRCEPPCLCRWLH